MDDEEERRCASRVEVQPVLGHTLHPPRTKHAHLPHIAMHTWAGGGSMKSKLRRSLIPMAFIVSTVSPRFDLSMVGRESGCCALG